MLERIKVLCKERGITVRELEKSLGFGNGTIGHWKKSKPKYDKILLVANYFGVSVKELLGEKETPATDGDGLAKMIIDLPSEFQESLVRFVSLASSNPDKATRFLLFAAAELESDAQDH